MSFVACDATTFQLLLLLCCCCRCCCSLCATVVAAAVCCNTLWRGQMANCRRNAVAHLFSLLKFLFCFVFYFLPVWQLLSQESQQINQATCAIKVDALYRVIRTVANDHERVERRDRELVIQQGLKYIV